MTSSTLASRLQSAAPPGGILVGQTTYALDVAGNPLRAGRRTRRHGPRAEHQGMACRRSHGATRQPFAARTQRSTDRPSAGTGHRARRTRSGQHRQPQRAAGDLRRERCRQVASRRRADRLPAQLGRRGGVVEGACVPYGEANVWFPIANALSRDLDLDPTLPVDEIRAVARQRAVQLLANVDDAEIERMVDVFVHLLGHPSTDRPARGACGASRRSIAPSRACSSYASQERPIVLSINDLHWADPALIDLLEHLVTSLSRHPFALITAMRPGSDVAWPPHNERATVVSLNLQPLGQVATEELAAQLLGDQCADPKLLTALYERSGGNPLFLHELAALAAAGRGIRELPNSLRALIIARLDQLAPDQRQIIENAATLGTSGSICVVADLCRRARPDSSTRREFASSTTSGCLEVHGRRWEFRSDSVRDAAYQTLTKAARARRHAGVAKAMANLPAGLDDRAHHTATAAELVKELGPVEGVSATISDEAVQLLTAAAERADDNGSLRVAVRHAGRALGVATDRCRAREPTGATGADPSRRAARPPRLRCGTRRSRQRIGQRSTTRRRRRRGRCPSSARHHAPRRRPSRRKPVRSSVRPSTCCARSIDPIASPGPCGHVVSSSCSAGR